MPHFSPRSFNELSACSKKLRDLFNEVIKHYDCIILDGHRGEVEQNEYYRTGKSKLQFPDSKHNYYPSLAVDVAPYPVNWNDTKSFYYFAGFVKGIATQMDIKIRFGGDWDSDNDLNDQTFMDLIHYELV